MSNRLWTKPDFTLTVARRDEFDTTHKVVFASVNGHASAAVTVAAAVSPPRKDVRLPMQQT